MRLIAGDKVRVKLPINITPDISMLEQFDGVETVIIEKRSYKTVSRTESVFRLSGVKSKYGIYYWLFSEWLVPLERKKTKDDTEGNEL